MRAYLGNRIGLAVSGAVLTGAGLYAWLRSQGKIGSQAAGDRILSRELPGHLSGHPWLGWSAALLQVVLALLAIRWLVRALGWGRWGSRSGSGTAMLGVALKEVEGLSRIHVRTVRGDRLRIAVSCEPTADVGKLVTRLNKDVVTKVRKTVGDEDLGASVRLHVRRR